MAKRLLIQWACVGLSLFSFGCEFDEPCQANDPALVKKFGIPKQQTQGEDGLCYAVDPSVPNWGGACDSLDLCGGGLICAAPQLPICTAIDCNPDNGKDKVCGKGFMCIATGENSPTVCVPQPPATPSTDQTASQPTDTAGDAGVTNDAGDDTSTALTPNVGTPCSSPTDPVCVGGTFCEAEQLKYCTLSNCAAGLENAAQCAAVGFCYSTAPAPATGICTVQ